MTYCSIEKGILVLAGDNQYQFEIRKSLSIQSGKLKRYDYDYARNGIPTFQVMQHEVACWVKKRNAKGIGINWQFTREKAEKKFNLM